MEIYNDESVSIKEPIVASIGFFDGVHQGHQFLIDQVKEEATKRGLTSAIITFIEHPRKVLQAEYQPDLLCGYSEKIKYLECTGIDCCIPMHFTQELALMTAYDFMKVVLKERFNVDTLVIGYDHRFGHDRSEGFEQYQEFGKELGINIVHAKELNTGEYVSSSEIRTLLMAGKIEKAAQMLTYNYTISGKIVEGFKVGRTIGYPTANIEVWERFKVVPMHGVYAVHVHIEGKEYKGMLYIGRRPTMQNGEKVSIEVNIFDFDGDLYGKDLTVEFIRFVRKDIKFTGLEVLKKQLQADERAVKKILEIE